MCRIRFSILLVTVVFVQSASSADWLQFRGPLGAGVSKDTMLPTKFSATKNLKWKSKLPGRGASSPIVVGEKVFLTCFDGYGVREFGGEPGDLRRHLVCLNKADGKILWKKTVKPVLPEDTARGFITGHGYASSTPASDGKNIYVFFGKSGVLCYDLDGKQVWKVSVGTGSDPRGWGSAASPVLYKGLVIINAIVESERIVALNKKTGKQAWEAKATGYGQCWSTPILVNVKGNSELVINVPNEIWGLNPTNGKLRWYADVMPGGAMCTSPVAHEGVVYGIGGRRSGGAAIRLGGRGDVSRSHLVYTNDLGSYVTSPVVSGDHVYWVSDRGIATCINKKTGKEVYRRRLSGARQLYASVTLADGKIYAVTRYNGIFVIDAKPKFKVLAHNKLDDESLFNASPVVVNGEILIRSDRYLYCIAAKKE